MNAGQIRFDDVANYRGALQLCRNGAGFCFWRVDCDVGQTPDWQPVPAYVFAALERYAIELLAHGSTSAVTITVDPSAGGPG